MTNINFNEKTARELVKEYNKAINGNKKQFHFHDMELLTRYAYYLIQLLVNEKLIKGNFNGRKIFETKPTNTTTP